MKQSSEAIQHQDEMGTIFGLGLTNMLNDRVIQATQRLIAPVDLFDEATIPTMK